MQHQMQRDNSDMGMNGQRPQSPASADNAPSPSKRPRLDGPFNGQPMGPNGRGQPPMGPNPQAAQRTAQMLRQNNINPASLDPVQFQNFQNQPPSAQAKSIQVYAQTLAQHHSRAGLDNQGLQNGVMNPGMMGNPGSPMMQPMPDGQNLGVAMNDMYGPNNPAAMQQMRMAATNGQQGGSHALQDYQMQLMLLEQQNKKRLMMARQEQDQGQRQDGMPGMPQQFPPGMSPQNSRNGPSPNPNDQMRRGTPKMMQQGLPGSPMPGDGGIPQTRGSPAAMSFPNGTMPQDVPPQFFQQNGPMGPNGMMMRPPSSHPGFNGVQMNQQMEALRAQGRMPNGGWPQGPQGQAPMMPQPPPGQQPQSMGTPQQRNEMPPPQAPPSSATAGRTNPSSPSQQSNAPPTPQQANKAAPKGKKDSKADRKVRYNP